MSRDSCQTHHTAKSRRSPQTTASKQPSGNWLSGRKLNNVKKSNSLREAVGLRIHEVDRTNTDARLLHWDDCISKRGLQPCQVVSNGNGSPWHLQFPPSPTPYSRGCLGHHRRRHNQFPPFLSVLHCPLGFGELKAWPFLNVVFPTFFFLSALSSFPFHCALQDGFGQT